MLTASGEVSPVVWVGRRHVDCRRHKKPEQVWPVRVRAGAFGEGLPRRDLWLSPDHAVLLDHVLIPIKHLGNGIIIEQMPVDEITYYHVELPKHDVLLAEGLPAESYLDTGDRSNFDNPDGVLRLFAGFSAPPWHTAVSWEAKGSAPLIVAGAALTAARRLVSSFTAAHIHATAAHAAG